MAFPWLINGGDPNYLLTGMILQVPGILEPVKAVPLLGRGKNPSNTFGGGQLKV